MNSKRTTTLVIRTAIIILAALTLIPAIPASAYTDHRGHNLDSLERAVARWTPDAIDRASTQDLIDINRACRDLMLGYSNINSPKSEFYARKALSISKPRGWEYATWDASKHIGQCFWAQEKYDSALFYYNEARKAIERMENGGTSPTAPERYSQAEIDDAKSSLYGAIGNLYSMQDSIPQAMSYYAKAGEIFEKYGWNSSNAVLHYNIGETWLDEGDFKAAKKAYLKALDYATAENDSLWIAAGHKGLGRLYLVQGKTGKALRELHQADEYFSNHDLEEAISRKENFEYMALALQKQKKQLSVIICAMALLVLLATGIILLGRKLRTARKEQEETAAVMEETLADLQNSKAPATEGAREISEREKEILDLLAKGYTSPQIADCLNLSAETVKWYRKKLLIKFDVANTAELVLRAKDSNLL